MAKIELTLILPRLARILEQQINVDVIPPYLSKIRAKAQFKIDLTGLDRLLFNHFSYVPLTGSDLPAASLLTNKSIAIKADPCYVYPDRDRLLLFADNLALTCEESDALIAEIQPLFLNYGAELVQVKPNSWLLHLEVMPDILLSALPDVNGKCVTNYLPRGEDQQVWIRLWNAIQMQLYDSNINQQRLTEGKLAINSIWFWGAGQFVAKKHHWTKVHGQLPLLQQLAQQSAIKLEEMVNGAMTSLSSGKHLWVLDDINTANDWQQQLQLLDEQVFQPLWRQVKMGKITQLHLQIPEHGHYTLSPLRSWNFGS